MLHHFEKAKPSFTRITYDIFGAWSLRDSNVSFLRVILLLKIENTSFSHKKLHKFNLTKISCPFILNNKSNTVHELIDVLDTTI